jgi:hypothetical protein
MTWDVLNVDFDHMVHDLEWEGDDGLKNLWGLFYKGKVSENPHKKKKSGSGPKQ